MEILQITGDKPEFSNFIGDTLILKEKSKVCLNKASFSIPVMVNRTVYLPNSTGFGSYTDTFFNVILNGLEIGITYQDFYDAFINLSSFENPTIAIFYSGIYQLYIDNLCTFIDNNDDEYDLQSFTAIMAEACNIKFDYYIFEVENKTEITNIGKYTQDIQPPLTINAIAFNKVSDNRRITNYGIVAMYAPRQMTLLTSNTVTWNLTNVNNFTPSGDGIVSVDANPAMAVCPNTFDPNGGWITATPQVNAGKLSMGLVFISKGHDDPLNITGVYQPENFDVGIEWYIDTGVRTFRIIDGHQHYVFSHGGVIQEQDLPHYVPPNKIFTWDHNIDRFWFIVRKGRPMNGTQEFTTTIVQGPGPDTDDVNNRVIYVATTTMRTSQIRIQTLAYSEGAGNGLDNWEYIPVSTDSTNEDDYLDDITTTDSRNGIRSAQTFAINPVIENTDWEDERNFWEAIGIVQTENLDNMIVTTEGNGYNKKLNWNLPVNGPRSYYFGTNQIIDTIDRDITTNIAPKLAGQRAYIINFIPRELSLSLLDMTINPRSGSFVRSNVTGNTGFFDTGTFNKVVNYIQTDKDDLDLTQNQLINYNYEAFNLVYRKLENQQAIPITQLKAKLSFKDFEQNNEVQIPSIYGVGKFELLFDTN